MIQLVNYLNTVYDTRPLITNDDSVDVVIKTLISDVLYWVGYVVTFTGPFQCVIVMKLGIDTSYIVQFFRSIRSLKGTFFYAFVSVLFYRISTYMLGMEKYQRDIFEFDNGLQEGGFNAYHRSRLMPSGQYWHSVYEISYTIKSLFVVVFSLYDTYWSKACIRAMGLSHVVLLPSFHYSLQIFGMGLYCFVYVTTYIMLYSIFKHCVVLLSEAVDEFMY